MLLLFPSQTLKRFNDQINSLSLGELILEENLFAQLRDEFKKWNDHLNRTKTSCEYIFNLKKHKCDFTVVLLLKLF